MTQQFETSYKRLEEILEIIQSGKVPLEETLKLYEEADQLIQWCSTTLNDAEKKIEILIKNRDSGAQVNDQGQPKTQPLSSFQQSYL
jgi:exodeoxyribonuclease VII small subunit